MTTSNSINEEVFLDLIQEYGCTDPSASNYNVEATDNNGSCKYDVLPQDVPGCLVDTALNYNLFANVDDNSCLYEQPVVYDVPPLTFAGFINDDIIELTETDVCHVDFSRVIDKIEILNVLEINSSDVEITWFVYQDTEISKITSLVNRSQIVDNVLIKLTISCSNNLIHNEVILLAKVSENDIEILTGSNSTINGDVVAVYPNPANLSLFVSDSGKIEIFNLEGKKVHSSLVDKGEKILLDSFNEGLYVVKISNKLGEFTTSFVKQ